MVKRINQATDEIITVGVMISLPQEGRAGQKQICGLPKIYCRSALAREKVGTSFRGQRDQTFAWTP
jgi:hypothetical protein